MRIPRISGAGRVDVAGFALVLGLTFALAITLVRVVQLQVAPSESLRPFIQDRLSTRPEIAPRGDLLDRRGRLLAATRTGEQLFIDPAMFPEPYEENFLRLAEAVGIDPSRLGVRLFERLEENRRLKEVGADQIRYVRLTGILDDAQAESVRMLKIPGVHLEMRTVREGPGADIASGILGRVGADDAGQFGAERVHDASLRGVSGSLRYVRDARGGPLWLEAGAYVPPRAGEEVRLSIDLVLQDIAEEELEFGVEDADAAGGRLVLMDPASGEVLAMVDIVRPLGNRALPWGQKTGRVSRRTVIPPDPNRALHPGAGRNRCFTDVFEPGSSFKPFVWSIITDAGLARLEEWFETGGQARSTSYGRPIRDVFGKPRQTWRDVLVNSSNIGMSMAVERIKPTALREALSKFGYGSRTGLGVPGDREGYLPPAKNWTKYTHTSVSFGQEIGVTAVQLARAFAVFARQGDMGGTLPPIRLTAAERGEAPPEMIRRVVSWSTANAARLAMARVMDAADRRMKAKQIEATFDYALFGKSGTAQVSLPGERGYLANQYISNFVCAGPIEAPRLVCVVVIDDPGPEVIARVDHRGSAVAAPVCRRVLERSLAYLGVPPSPRGEGEIAAAPGVAD